MRIYLFLALWLLASSALAQETGVALVDSKGYFYIPTNAARSLNAVDSRLIAEGTTNILCIGIDSADFQILRIYLSQTNALEFRSDGIWRWGTGFMPNTEGGSGDA